VARGRRDGHGDVLLQAGVALGVVGDPVLKSVEAPRLIANSGDL